MQDYLDKLSSDQAMEFIKKIEKYFKDLPHLPKNLTEALVNFSPVLAIIGAVLSAIAGLMSLKFAVFGPMGSEFLRAVGVDYSGLRLSSLVMAVYQALSAVLLYLAYKPLKSRKLIGWIYTFWLVVLGIVFQVVSLFLGHFNTSSVLGIVIGMAISFYMLFELKPFFSRKGMSQEEATPDSPSSK